MPLVFNSAYNNMLLVFNLAYDNILSVFSSACNNMFREQVKRTGSFFSERHNIKAYTIILFHNEKLNV